MYVVLMTLVRIQNFICRVNHIVNFVTWLVTWHIFLPKLIRYEIIFIFSRYFIQKLLWFQLLFYFGTWFGLLSHFLNFIIVIKGFQLFFEPTKVNFISFWFNQLFDLFNIFVLRIHDKIIIISQVIIIILLNQINKSN